MKQLTKTQNIFHKLKDIAIRHNISSIYAFGSRSKEIAALIKGEPFIVNYPISDVDIGVQPVHGYRHKTKEKVCLTLDLENLFQAHRIDLVVLTEASAFLALDIIKGELIFCTNYDDQAEQELYFLRMAGDLAYFERQRRSQILWEG